MSMNMSYTISEVIAQYADVGVCKGKHPALKLITLGVLGGGFIALASVATNTAAYGVQNVGIARMICGLLFPFGLAMVVLTGSELFTGNCLMVISVLDKRCAIASVLRNWIIVYLANLAGSLFVAAGCAFFGQMNYSGGALALYTMKVAAGKCALPFCNAIVLGFFCNVLVCLGILLAMTAKDTFSRIMGVFLPLCYFVLCGFEHSVANMYYIPAGLMARLVPAYAKVAESSGLDLSALTVSNFLLHNLLPVTIGNILGGALLGYVMWLVYLRKDSIVSC